MSRNLQRVIREPVFTLKCKVVNIWATDFGKTT